MCYQPNAFRCSGIARQMARRHCRSDRARFSLARASSFSGSAGEGIRSEPVSMPGDRRSRPSTLESAGTPLATPQVRAPSCFEFHIPSD
jgi:hypothetical protein